MSEAVPRSKLRVRDLIAEASAAVLARPGRAVLTTLGTVLGIGALVATLGLSKTAGNQIVGRFDALAATEVQIQPRDSGFYSGPGAPVVKSYIPFDAERRIRRLNGVKSVGTLADVDVKGSLARAVPVVDPLSQTEFQISVKAASPGLFQASKTTLMQGRFFDDGHSQRGDRVAILGPGAASQLGIDRVDNQPGIFVGDRLYTVVGIIADTVRQPSMLDAIVLPNGTAMADWDLKAPTLVEIDTSLGAARQIGEQAPLALSPNQPEQLRASVPPEPKRTKRGVQSDLQALFLTLGGVSLIVGAIGIANVTLVSVLERVGEIGLRRALGAGRRHITVQFLVESMVIGLIGGIIGASLATLIIVGVSASKSWTPVLDAWVPLAAPFLGAMVGLLAGLYPALRAASLQPVEALRSGT